MQFTKKPIKNRDGIVIGIVVPAHDEQSHIDASIVWLVRASAWPQLRGDEVLMVVVLDACRDRTGNIARSLSAKTIDAEARIAGVARCMGVHIVAGAGRHAKYFFNEARMRH